MKDYIEVLLRASEIGAIMAYKNIGSKDSKKVDEDTVKAINKILTTFKFPGKVIIGEGELENAPLLYPGQTFSNKIKYDIAVDPIEGTHLVANNNPGAITSLAIAKKNSIAKIPEMYMEKLFVSQELKDFIDLSKGIKWNLKNLKNNLKNRELKVIILNKPRHQEIIKFMKSLNFYIYLIDDGDVMGAIDVVNGEADFVYGIGGSPEGALMASLAIASDCKMEWSLKKINSIITSKSSDSNQFQKEQKQIKKTKYVYDKVYSCYDLINDQGTVFVSSAITSGNSLKGTRYKNNKFIVMSILAHDGIVRNITSTYHLNKILKYNKKIQFIKST